MAKRRKHIRKLKHGKRKQFAKKLKRKTNFLLELLLIATMLFAFWFIYQFAYLEGYQSANSLAQIQQCLRICDIASRMVIN